MREGESRGGEEGGAGRGGGGWGAEDGGAGGAGRERWIEGKEEKVIGDCGVARLRCPALSSSPCRRSPGIRLEYPRLQSGLSTSSFRSATT